MNASVRFAASRGLEVELPAERVIAHCGVPAGQSVTDVTAATAAVIAAPLDFPPLSKAVVPGDRVVLALDHDVPHGADIVAALADCLVEHGLNPSDLTLLTFAPGESADQLRRLLPAAYREAATVAVHDPDARDRLGYLAVGSDDQPIYLNRLLCDADVVIPIGCLRCEPALDYHGMYGGLFPTFSSRQAQDKLFAHALSQESRDEARNRKQIQEVGWLLGVQFTVQVVPGPGGEVLQVLAGNADEVFRVGQAACQRAWASTAPRAAQLVVATLDGGPDEQTWDNVARALAASLRITGSGGAIVLCTTLAEMPGPTLRLAAEAKDSRDLLRTIGRRRVDDAVPAIMLSQALGQARVYMKSELDDATVEDLGMTPIASAVELSRLAARHTSCILLSNAQYAVVTIEGE